MIEDIKQGDNLNRDDLIELIDNHLPPPLVSYIRVEGYYGDLISILQDVYQSGRKNPDIISSTQTINKFIQSLNDILAKQL
ncbi:MAG: hypothetical protein IPI97_06085 [Nitrosomonas sp.]|nr:hypothetical protein [Nitrosomonas sp.]MBK7364570.1 hypothetical protein [Nitrosomonas sp.]